MNRSACLSVWILALIGVHASVATGLAQDDFRTLAQGTHLFRRTLSKLRPLQKIEDLAGSEEKKLLVVLGETQVLDTPGFDLDDWVRRGGAVLIATDRDTSCQALEAFGLQVLGVRVRVNADADFAYKRNPYCVLVELTNNPASKAIFHNPSRIATNFAGIITVTRTPTLPSLKYLLRFPAAVSLERNGKALERRRQMQFMHFAAGGPWEKGRFLLLSDHSVFINSMMAQDDNDNIDFAYDCIEWLTDSGKRTEALFYEEGKVQTRFDLDLKMPPPPNIPPPEELIAVLNKGLAGIEEENGFNRALREIAGGTNVPLQVVGLVLTIAAAGFVFSRLVHARQRFEPGVPHLASSAPPWMPAVEILDQRQRAILRQGNFWEPARLQARQEWDLILGASRAPARGARALAPAPTPPVTIRGHWWERHSLQRLTGRLWRLAYGSEPVWISARRWRRVERDLRTLRQAFAAGKVHPLESRL
jgi:hypothetical protein